ncbi:YbjN domain-containing protein [Zhengella sp. ZM62]|uniref:YbjN domain-containing protein n=1 Tax=Zhengella sedimenti TaxID=3390035 RepID=UPI003975B2D0
MSLIDMDMDDARTAHPVDVIEQVALHYDWAFERSADDELSVSVAGSWTDYHVSFSWMEDFEALHTACAFDLKVPEKRAYEVMRLLSLINEQLLFGHFDLWQREGAIMFRHTLILPGGLEPTALQIQTMLNSALESCEAYFQCFQFVIWAGQTAEQAMQGVNFETCGTA